MKLVPFFVAVTFLMSCSTPEHLYAQSPTPAQSPDEVIQAFQRDLAGKILALRTPYPGNKLKFNQDLAITTKAQRGLYSMDALVKVVTLHFHAGGLEITGSRMVVLYTPKMQAISITDPHWPVKIDVELPGHDGSASAVSRVLNKLFLTEEELTRHQCSDSQKIDFEKWVTIQNVNSAKKVEKSTDTALAPNPVSQPSHCFPTGFPVFLVLEGVNPPKAIATPDPQYTNPPRDDRRFKANAIFAFAIDEQGEPLDALALSGSDPRWNYASMSALRKWRFQPATLNGKPVPVVIKVDFNFSLY